MYDCQNEKGKCDIPDVAKDSLTSIFSDYVSDEENKIRLKIDQEYKRKKYCSLCRSKSNSLLIILGVYLIVFSIASVILIMSVLSCQISSKIDGNSTKSVFHNNYNVKENYKLNQILNGSLFPKIIFREFKWPFKASVFNCSDLSAVEQFKYVTSGWTKNVFSFKHKNINLALKSVNINGVDMKNCLKENSMKLCYERASLKMLKEYILSYQLSNSNIIKVLAWCISDGNVVNEIAIVTELCTPIDLISILRMSFFQRLKMMLDLSQLLVYLAHSPVGSVAINDFQRQQFVLCGNTLKLTDLDDLSIDEPKCNDSSDCNKLMVHLNLDENVHYELKCINNFCKGYNEKLNIINAYKNFVSLFLNISVPFALQGNVEDVLERYKSNQNAEVLHEAFEQLHSNFLNLNETHIY